MRAPGAAEWICEEAACNAGSERVGCRRVPLAAPDRDRDGHPVDDRAGGGVRAVPGREQRLGPGDDSALAHRAVRRSAARGVACLLYTSDAADERSSVDLG